MRTEARQGCIPNARVALTCGVCVFSVTLLIGVAVGIGDDGGPGIAAVPTDVEMPGTQPLEVTTLEDSSRCLNCHGGYDLAVEPGHNWGGSMMAQAGRDPIFWATMAIAEQDFPGAGDICLRCHAGLGWYDGRSEPTNGSGLVATDADGVTCDICHKMTNPDDAEWLGEQFPPYLANDEGNPPIGYYGTGMLSLWGGNEKHGPYFNTVARHSFLGSNFMRSREYCGSCHDVSNSVVGDLAHNAGAQPTADPVERSGVPNAPVETKAAFNNFPFMYGVVERTFSEHMASAFADYPVTQYPNLPAELQDGVLEYAYTQSLLAGTNGNFEDGSTRYFTCQTCHMAPVVGKGCDKNNAETRFDLAQHDLTGGNYWMSEAIQNLDSQGKLVIGGGLTNDQVNQMNDGAQRAKFMLDNAADMRVENNALTVINLTGHKLISGYPEGRRMWLNIKWYNQSNILVREDGEYGLLDVTIDGDPARVETILDLDDPNTKIYEAHYAMTQEWANQLLGLGYSPDMALTYDRVTGDPDYTLGELAAQDPGTAHETFHFVLNNHVSFDNRIPPYGMEYEKARQRNTLPVPADQFGDPGPGGVYNHWDEVELNPPATAVRAEISLMYQPTSWEYIRFLYEANDGTDPFLGTTGADMLDAWLATGMAPPHVMYTEEWTGSGGGGGFELNGAGNNSADRIRRP